MQQRLQDNAKAVDGLGTKNLVDAAKKAGVKKFVLVTSLCGRLVVASSLRSRVRFCCSQVDQRARNRAGGQRQLQGAARARVVELCGLC